MCVRLLSAVRVRCDCCRDGRSSAAGRPPLPGGDGNWREGSLDAAGGKKFQEEAEGSFAGHGDEGEEEADDEGGLDGSGRGFLVVAYDGEPEDGGEEEEGHEESS